MLGATAASQESRAASEATRTGVGVETMRSLRMEWVGAGSRVASVYSLAWATGEWVKLATKLLRLVAS